MTEDRKSWDVVFDERDIGGTTSHLETYTSEKEARKAITKWTKRNPRRYSAAIYPLRKQAGDKEE